MPADRQGWRRATGSAVWAGVCVALCAAPAWGQGIPEENQSSTFSFSLDDTILPGNFLPNPDMETETRFADTDIAPNGNSHADYWHHSVNGTWSNGTTDPALSGELMQVIDAHREPYADFLERHFGKHLDALVAGMR